MNDYGMRRFEGKNVVVTGGAQGIGKAIAQRFTREGARVFIADLQEEKAKEVALELGGFSTRCDVSSAQDVDQMIAEAISALGSIDILCNNAGTITMRSTVELTEEDWDQNMDVNAKGTFLCTRAVLPHMLERKQGAIVNTASQAGKRGYKLFTHYSASKAAVILFSKGVALEVAPYVRINCVCPGIVSTDMMEREYAWEEEMTGDSKASIQERWMSGIPMQRFQTPDHVAGVVAFLASEDASEMTGQAINVTGGMVME
ncbi:SDR family NAD(P)-dependent oxidoreductase [[Micrococcus luteus] ATCC 49442]|uniref:SDR family NAD(P)-dependent oxidoreductase n=1 Tax=[Micrococcus luteus] ATCC 49442 TaxID=2698727 RepID=UPI001AD67785|nr:SDR family NAD(P)-dependent oxidoreductase [[Micrococcus luteus] ATCC 49442]